jgi:hypothetical protein
MRMNLLRTPLRLHFPLPPLLLPLLLNPHIYLQEIIELSWSCPMPSRAHRQVHLLHTLCFTIVLTYRRCWLSSAASLVASTAPLQFMCYAYADRTSEQAAITGNME